VSDAPKVLVIDDDEGIRDFVSLALTDEGYEVEGAANGAAGLAAVEESRPALILLDTRMPVMDGIEFARVYRTRPRPHAPIVLLTAAADAASLAEEITPDAVLAKPFDLDELLALVQHYASGE
jgi:CheY-like chemotaxis protein